MESPCIMWSHLRPGGWLWKTKEYGTHCIGVPATFPDYSKGEGRIKSLWFFCLDRRGSSLRIYLYFFVLLMDNLAQSGKLADESRCTVIRPWVRIPPLSARDHRHVNSLLPILEIASPIAPSTTRRKGTEMRIAGYYPQIRFGGLTSPTCPR